MNLIVDALATARLTRLVTRDTIADHLRRDWIAEAYRAKGRDIPEGVDPEVFLWNDPDPPVWAEFIRCPFCVSVWAGFGVVAARRFAPRLWGPIAAALAMSEVAILAARHEGGDA